MRQPSLKLVSFSKGFLLCAVTRSKVYRVLRWHWVAGGDSIGIVRSAPSLQRSYLGCTRKEDSKRNRGDHSICPWVQVLRVAGRSGGAELDAYI